MSNNHFSFKQFTIYQKRSAFKVGTDGVILGAWAGIENVSTILDAGTGTGLIALMLAQRSNANITAIEPDTDSFEEACENVNRTNWKERVKVLNMRLQDINPSDMKFDMIVSNPPYFKDSLISPDPRKSVARHSFSLPHNELLYCSEKLLNAGGRLEIIMPYDEGNVLIAIASGAGLYCNKIIKIRPTPSSEIRRLMLSFSRERSVVLESFLTIEKGKRFEFTQEYIDLTKEFYLKL